MNVYLIGYDSALVTCLVGEGHVVYYKNRDAPERMFEDLKRVLREGLASKRYKPLLDGLFANWTERDALRTGTDVWLPLADAFIVCTVDWTNASDLVAAFRLAVTRRRTRQLVGLVYRAMPWPTVIRYRGDTKSVIAALGDHPVDRAYAQFVLRQVHLWKQTRAERRAMQNRVGRSQGGKDVDDFGGGWSRF
jgi:hypothetical protein